MITLLMWFDINFNNHAVELLPIKWRKPIKILFLKVLLKPIIDLYFDWCNWRINNLYKIEHTGQICYLRGSLNDSFDPIERRIYITDGVDHNGLYIYTEAENVDVWLYTEAENKPLWLRTEGETVSSGLDYIIYVPQQLYDSQLPDLKAHIDFYRVAGKRYKIFIDE